jgi:ATP synthase protein I
VVTVALPEARRVAFGVVVGQAVVTGVVALVCWALSGSSAAESAAIGGGIGTVASLVLVLLAFGSRTGDDPRRAARAFYVGEASKLAITIALFVVVLNVMDVRPGAFFAGYMATFFAYWVALARST